MTDNDRFAMLVGVSTYDSAAYQDLAPVRADLHFMRAVLLKDVGPAGWSFAAHAASPKGRDLAATPAAALTFCWPQQARQVRLRGAVVPGSPELSAQDFLARSLGSRAEALAGRQSRPLDDPKSVAAAAQARPAHLPPSADGWDKQLLWP
jgi:pyridoxamine 5'-phosphate oxidase